MTARHGEVLDLGCGREKVDGATGVDHPDRPDELTQADLRHDLDELPYPFEDESVQRIYMNDSLEYLENPVRAIVECYTILRQGGELIASVPQDDQPRKNPFHRSHLSPEWFLTFDPSSRHWCRGEDWKDKPRFDVDTRISYHGEFPTNIRDLVFLPFYWLKSPDSDFYDFPRGKRNQLEVRMVKKR